MKIEIYLVIIQAIQLPIIILLIALCIKNQSVEEVIFYDDPWDKIKARKRTLSLIGIALLFNLIYILINIDINAHLFNLNHQSIYITLTNVMTTNFMYCAWILWVSMKRKLNKGIVILLLCFITCLSISLAYLKLNNQGEDIIVNGVSYIFDFCAYLVISNYFYRQMTMPKIFNRRSRNHNIFLMLLFGLWAILQLAAPIAQFYGASPEQVSLYCFSLSTFIKISVLYLMYSYYVGIAQSALMSRAEQNIVLKDNILTLSTLQKMINEVHAAHSSNDMAELAIRHLTDPKLFKFDYAIISLVNFLERKISYHDSYTQHPEIKNLHRWKVNEGISLDSHDIVATAARKKMITPVYGNYVDNEEIRDEEKKSLLNKDIFEKYNHKLLYRYFIPVTKLREENSEVKDKLATDRAIALIEAGNLDARLLENARYYNAKRKPEPNRNFEQLKLYIESFYQSFNRILEQETNNRIEEIMSEADIQSKDDHINYLEKVLEGVCKYIKADCGIIAIIPYNNISSEYNETFIHYKINNTTKQKIKDRVKNITQSDNNRASNISYLMDAVRSEISLSSKLLSSKMSPILLDGHIIGYIFTFAKNAVYFNSDTDAITQKMISHVGKMFNKKRFHNAVEKLTRSDNAITDPSENIRPIVKSIQDYFQVRKVVAILTKNHINRKSKKDLDDINEYMLKNFLLGDDESESDKHQIINLLSFATKEEANHILDYASKNQLSSLVQVPITFNQKKYGVINIFFKNPVSELFPEDHRFLKIIAAKAALTIQIQHLLSAFIQISASFTQNDSRQTLITIAENAADLLNADHVILFKSYNGNDIFFKDSIYITNMGFRDENIESAFKNKFERVQFPEQIINDKTIYFSSENEYLDFICRKEINNETSIFNNKFWASEELKGMAALQLINKVRNTNNVPVGVMLINFKSPVTFNDETRKLAQSLAYFAAAAIEAGFVFEKNHQFLMNNLRMSKPLITEIDAAGALHNANKNFRLLCETYYTLTEKIDTPGTKKTISVWDIRADLQKFETPLEDLRIHFDKFETDYKPGNELKIGKHNVSQLIQDKLTLIQESFKFKNIQVIFAEVNINIDCDDIQLGNVFQNLITNAFQALDHKGTLEIRVQNLDEKDVKIEIIDNGKGISKDIYDYILEPYITDKQGGSGLGLPISKLIVDRHGGTLKYSSSNNRTKFTVILPLKPPIADFKTVLFIENDTLVRNTRMQHLNKHNIRNILSPRSAEECKTLVQNNLFYTAIINYDLTGWIELNAGLPIAIGEKTLHNGLDLAIYLSEMNPKIKIVMYSSDEEGLRIKLSAGNFGNINLISYNDASFNDIDKIFSNHTFDKIGNQTPSILNTSVD